MASVRWLQTWSVGLVVAALSACGGGGGGGDDTPAPTVRPALPTLVQDIAPAGERLDLRSRNYFPAQAGDSWTYDQIQGGITTPGGAALWVQTASGSDAWFSERVNGQTVTGQWRRTAEGVVSVDPLAGAAPAAVRTLVGDMLEYPEPFYAVGAERRAIRQGSWGEDLDGDGIAESFRLEVVQVLVGFETLTLPRGSAETAHFRSTTTLTVSPSLLANPLATLVAIEDSWWAPGIGRVAVNRVAVDGNGASVEPAYALRITSGSVGGEPLFQQPPDGTVLKLALAHNALVYDRSRGVYYASVPASAASNGNSIARIDAASGQVTYSAPVGANPGALAVSADGTALYVGLDGSGEVLRLTLPAMQEVTRTRLPVSPFWGQYLADNLAVSPVDPGVVAVSMRRAASPRHAGVALIRDGVLQPQVTQEHTGSNLIVFADDGQWLYGYNNESTEDGLRRLEVLPDGLAERQVVITSGGFTPWAIDVSAVGPVVIDGAYRGTDLALLGRVSAPGGGCRLLRMAQRLVCLQESWLDSSPSRHLVVADSGSFVTLATPAYTHLGSPGDVVAIVPGPAGQVALRIVGSAGSSVWLFTSPMLP